MTSFSIDQLPTPAVLVERARLERNIQRMQRRADRAGVTLRPHVKTHKAPTIARLQIDAGANGLTSATPKEALALAKAGFDDLRIAYPVIGDAHYLRLLDIAETARVSFCVDSSIGVDLAQRFFRRHETPVCVLLKVDCGYGRAGQAWNSAELRTLAEHVSRQSHLRLVGILTHAGHSYGVQAQIDTGQHETLADALADVANQERDHMLAAALALRDCFDTETPEISIGSTPSMSAFENRREDGLTITEIRPGNYVFNDLIQVGLGVASPDDCALTVLATVVSSKTGRCLIDSGKKTLTSDTSSFPGYGLLLADRSTMAPLDGYTIETLSEEHGWVELAAGAPQLEVGQRVCLLPNHACVVVNTQSRLYLTDGDEVVTTFEVIGRA